VSSLRNTHALTFRPRGLSDAVDGSNAFPGAMSSLINLVPDPSTADLWVARPAAVQLTSLPTIPSNTFISTALVVGDILYGLVASALNPGHDQPFAYNLQTGVMLTVNGITAGNVPLSPSPTGPWTPPIAAQVGSRIIVTHPGFPGGAVKFGWFDVSGLATTAVVNTANGSPILTGNPAIAALQPGLSLSGAGIPIGATVQSFAPFVLVESGTTHTNTTLDGLSTTVGLAIGQTVVGGGALGIPVGTTIAAVLGPSSVQLSAPATASATGSVTFSGATITMSQNATATNSSTTVGVFGGTAVAPLWGAGDTNRNPLPSIPVGVAQFNARAYYALGVNGVVFSDAGIPCQVSNSPAVQALTTNDGLAVTAIGALPLSSPLTGGIIQAIIVFEGASKMQQITGDPTTNNLSMNAMPMATGTLSPLSVQPTERGLAFMSPDGLRFVTFNGTVTAPVGYYGKGVSAPFVYAQQPSRIAIAANHSVLRITNLSPRGVNIEFWYDLNSDQWSGPHTFPTSLIQAWRETYIVTGTIPNGGVYQSDVLPSGASLFTELGQNLAWYAATSLLPDNSEMAMNSLVEMTWALSIPGIPYSITVVAMNENGSVMDMTSVVLPPSAGSTIWDQFNWGFANWDGGVSAYQQRSVNWNGPLVFKQMSVQANGRSGLNTRVGNLYMRWERLGYRLQDAA
jgi:hypothetical protein